MKTLLKNNSFLNLYLPNLKQIELEGEFSHRYLNVLCLYIPS